MRVALLLALAFGLAGGLGCTDVHGRFVAQGRPLGDWELAPDDCESGQPRDFFGVNLWRSDAQSRMVRLVEDPVQGHSVVVMVPGMGDPGLALSRASCTRLEANLSFDTVSEGDGRDLGGWLELECATPDQGSFRGSVSFDHCH
ncbi:MAG TPA: hypothetical protein VKN99_28055 [Polyangia bacterium]|nr:hypothetical protein [Polyangia bacterium]